MNTDVTTFFCIGAAKTGTTWLYGMLNKHPEVQMPPIKELDFFHHLEGKESYQERFESEHWMNKGWRQNIEQSINNLKENKNVPASEWKLNYSFINMADPDPSQSVKKFKFLLDSLIKNQKKAVGDFSHTNAQINEETLSLLCQNFPTAKAIYIIRNPIDRDWSQFRFNKFVLGHNVADSEEELKNYFTYPIVEEQNKYLEVIDRWSKFLDESQLLVLSYDELKKDPVSFINKATDFIGLSRLENLPPMINKRRNESPSQEMSVAIKSFLEEKHSPLIKELKQHPKTKGLPGVQEW